MPSEIQTSPTFTTLLSERTPEGTIPRHAYFKWKGAHWVLSILADLGYPPGDQSLIPLREQVLEWLFSEEHTQYFKKRIVAGKVRMHPSQEGNAVYYLIKLGLVDERIEALIQRMLDWQWPDGGWNCDMKPHVQISSFNESLIPLRAFTAYRDYTGDQTYTSTIEQIAEIFLKRCLYKRLSNGNVMNSDFKSLHYPCYWHYDILYALKVLAEADLISDPRCADALDLLESKRLPDGGFPAEKKYYQADRPGKFGNSVMDWGGTSKLKSNPWVTADALRVLEAAGRRI